MAIGFPVAIFVVMRNRAARKLRLSSFADEGPGAGGVDEDQEGVDAEFEDERHSRENEGDAIDGSHQQEDAAKAAPTVWDRVVLRSEY